MAYDDYRERRPFDDEYRRSEIDRSARRRDAETRWAGESSWGYGREYDEKHPERFRGSFDRGTTEGSRFGYRAGETRGIRHYGTEEFEHPLGGYRAESVYGGSQPGEPLFTGGGFESWRTDPERFRSGWRRRTHQTHTGSGYGTSYGFGAAYPYGTGYGYGTSRSLEAIPRGRFTGRGPKGYQRSDDRIREDVSEELAQNGDIDASEIEVKVASCVVTLDGDVETRDDKRLAEDIAEMTPGVREVHNNLRVKKGFFARLFGIDDEEEERERSYAATPRRP